MDGMAWLMIHHDLIMIWFAAMYNIVDGHFEIRFPFDRGQNVLILVTLAILMDPFLIGLVEQ